MTHKKRKMTVMFAGFLLVFSLIIVGLLQANFSNIFASAEESTQEGFVAIDYDKKVEATYDFSAINSKECNVRLSNLDVATTAIIPSCAKINGKDYSVTEIFDSGFASATNLTRVVIPDSVKKIGTRAFAGCPELISIEFQNVEEIGGNAFYRCPKLKEIFIPKSVKVIGSYAFRFNNTSVEIREEKAGENWNANWNKGNTSSNINYASTKMPPLILERELKSSRVVADYALATCQPCRSYIAIESDSDEQIKIDENNNFYIPKEYQGIPITSITNGAFDGSEFNNLVIEYSDQPINIESGAFANALSDMLTDNLKHSVIINRPVTFKTDALDSDYIFENSELTTIVLPNSLEGIVDGMFNKCEELSNIFFIEPEDYGNDKEAMLEIVDKAKKDLEQKYNLTDCEGIVYLPNDSGFNKIGKNAFYKTTSIKYICIYDNVKTVGQDAFGDWINGQQHIYIDNEERIEFSEGKWNNPWKENFTDFEIKYDIYEVLLDANGGNLTCSAFLEAEYDKPIEGITEPYRFGYKFDGWYLNDSKFDISKFDMRNDITLVAKWIDRLENAYQCLLNSNIEEYSISHYTSSSKVVIELPSYFKTYCVIKVPSTVRQLHIYSAKNSLPYNMCIQLERRVESIDLLLENLSINAPSQSYNNIPHNCINTVSPVYDSTINLYSYGQVILKGAAGISGTSSSKNGQDGTQAIYCANIAIKHAENLQIYGGNGGAAYSGGTAGKGGFGILAVQSVIIIREDNSIINCTRGCGSIGDNNIKIEGGYSGNWDTQYGGWVVEGI